MQGESPTVSDHDLRQLWQHWAWLDAATERPARPYNPDLREYTYSEIAEELGLTKQRVQAIERRALKKLRTLVEERGWEAGFLALLG